MRRGASAPPRVAFGRVTGPVETPQAGLLALGTSSHAYLELDLVPGAAPPALVPALADLREPRTTIGGVNLVVGLRPELWRDAVAGAMPPGLHGFDRPVIGPDGFSMPATQHDAVLWLAGAAYDVVFDVARRAITALAPVATVADETSSWPYQHDRDLTGFIDGTENPSLARAPTVALVPAGVPGAGGSVLLLQRWVHHVASWEALPVAAQELVIGRTQGQLRGARSAPRQLTRRPHRPGRGRRHLPPQHALRHGDRARHDVRRVRRRATAARRHARADGRHRRPATS